MLVDVNIRGCLTSALQKSGTILCTDINTRDKLLSAMKDGDHTYVGIALDDKSHTREVVKITAVDGVLALTCRGVSHTTPCAFPKGSIVDSALASSAFAAELIGDVHGDNSN